MREDKKRYRIGIQRKTAVAMVTVFVIAIMLTASAGILSYYGTKETTANVLQSVVTSDNMQTWHNYDEPIIREIEDMVHCTDYCYKDWIWNRACDDAPIELSVEWLLAPGGPEGFDVTQFVFGETQTIRLVQKVVDFGNAPWAELPDGKEALLTFSTCAQEFNWNIESESDLSGYSLIYYANYPDYWEATPVFVIGGLSGSVDIPSMPYANDENTLRPISDEGETYSHQYGAKFWLVPIDAIGQDDVNWGMSDLFLFETDLGFYTDCSELIPTPIPFVWEEFNLLDGTYVLLKSETVYCRITCNHVDMNIIPGTYKYQQIVNTI